MSSLPPKKFPTLETLNTRLGVKIFSVLTPIDAVQFVKIMEAIGFHDIQGTATAPDAFRGFKGSTQFYVDQTKRVFGVIARNANETFKTFGDIVEGIKDYWRVDIPTYIGFYEFEYNASYHSSQNAYKVMSKVYQDSKLVKKLSQLIGEPVATFNIRLTPRGKDALREEWFDITIEPRLASEGKVYAIRALYRDKQISKVRKFGMHAHDLITSIIKEIEKGV